ncbi:MAG: hypothetical protein AAB296_03835 [Candidatus Desantisbacteria bacterium]
MWYENEVGQASFLAFASVVCVWCGNDAQKASIRNSELLEVTNGNKPEK